MFGAEVFSHFWLSKDITNVYEKAELKSDHIFKLTEFMQTPFYTWYGRDVMAEGDTTK